MSEEEREYLTLDEAAEAIGLKRPSIYHYLNALGIERHRFKFSRHSYITKADVERIKHIKEKPWTANEDEGTSLPFSRQGQIAHR